MTFNDNLKKYAKLIIEKCLNIKEGDFLVIRGQAENREFINLLTETAFMSGARDVKVNYRDEVFSKIRYKYASLDTVSEVPEHFIMEQNFYMDKSAKFLSLTGEDPNLLKDIPADKIKASTIAFSKALKDFNNRMMNSENSWCVAGAAVPSWAKTVFPDLDEKEATLKLWELIFYTSRADLEDPVAAWEKHTYTLKRHSKFLNQHQFDYFIIKSDNGTNLKVGMPKNYIFEGASEYDRHGNEFIANIPTEEVFSLPHKDRIDGIVYNTKPLNYNGALIDDFYLRFKDGQVVDFDATIGYEVLKNLLETDEGSKSLGEIAFVPYDSPISNTGILFYNTLYDENASCHIALGKAYPTCLKGGEDMDVESLKKEGANDSLIHVDFMIGDKTTNVIGVKDNGEKIDIFKDGNFAF